MSEEIQPEQQPEQTEQQSEQPKKKKDEEYDAYAEYFKEPRYDVGLQKPDDLCCYKDFFHTKTLSEAKEVADLKAAETGRATIVYDRHEFNIIYRVAAVNQPEPPKPPQSQNQTPIKRGGKGKVKRK